MTPQKIIHLIVAARPNFMKMAPLYHALNAQEWCTPILVHTGQHFDANMSDAFFKDLKLPEPDHHLGCGGGNHAHQTARIMMAYDDLLASQSSVAQGNEAIQRAATPDLVIVAGDVNSTLACALVAKKRHIAVAHLEAGLRSFDMSMPEELNRKMVDSISDILLTPSSDANQHLANEGISDNKIALVGNIMIDSFVMLEDQINRAAQNVPKDPYALCTLHRPSNVDCKHSLQLILEQLSELSKEKHILLPIHPRTRKNCEEFGLIESVMASNITLKDPLPYIDFMALMTRADLVLTDSGGLQEETTYLGIPCLTLRENTERPITVLQGTNTLISADKILLRAQEILGNPLQQKPKIDLWDGQTAQRVAEYLKSYFQI